MGCEHIEERLSAYFDGELNASESAAVEAHLSDCSRCSDELVAMNRLRELAVSLSDAEDAPPAWEAFETRLNASSQLSTTPSVARYVRPIVVGVLLTLAASIFIAMSVVPLPSIFDRRTSTNKNDTALHMRRVLESFEKAPTTAMESLAKDYAGREIARDSELAKDSDTRLLTDDIRQGRELPGKAQLVSIKKLRLPYCSCADGKCCCGPDGCFCVACVCKRPDGSEYLVLEHCKSQAVDFDDLDVRIVKHGDKQYQQISFHGSQTISWEESDVRRTVVGVKDLHEIDSHLARN